MAADITQIFRLLSKSDTSGIDKATGAVKKHGDAIQKAGQQAARASGGFSRAAGAIKSLGSWALNVARGALSKLWGALKGLATLAGGALMAGLGMLGRGLNALPDLFDKGTEAAEKLKAGAGAAFNALKKSVDNLRKSSKEMFGALGKVGAGFVQAAKKAVKAPIALFKGLIKGAGGAVKALGAVAAIAAIAGVAVAQGFFGAIAAASPRAAAALQRIGSAFDKAKTAFFGALGETLAPLLERVATLMEDPRFIEFATKFGEKVGGAILRVANFIEKRLIPGWTKIIQATGPMVAAIRLRLGQALTWLRETFSKTLASFRSGWNYLVKITKSAMKNLFTRITSGFRSIKTSALVFLVTLKARLVAGWASIKESAGNAFDALKERLGDIWDGIKSKITDVLSGITSAVSGAIGVIQWAMSGLQGILEAPWNALSSFVSGVWGVVLGGIELAVNSVINILNGLIRGFNNTLARVPGVSKIGELPPVSLAEGGIVTSPLLAVVGDAPRSPEVVAPLDKLAAMLREMGGAGGVNINVTVAVAPGGFATPESAGRRVGDAVIDEMKARGIRL